MKFRAFSSPRSCRLRQDSPLAQEQAFTNRSTDLKDKASADGKTLATPPENAALKVLQRSGAWTRVEANGQAGYVRAFHMRFPATVEGGGSLPSGAAATSWAASSAARSRSRRRWRHRNPRPQRRGLQERELLTRWPSGRCSPIARTTLAERFAREAKLALGHDQLT
jgi:hypothetical protein